MEQNSPQKENGGAQKQELKEKLKQAINKTLSAQPNGQIPKGGGTVVKVMIVAGTVVFVVWASRYVFLALAGTIRAFKELKRSIVEK